MKNTTRTEHVIALSSATGALFTALASSAAPAALLTATGPHLAGMIGSAALAAVLLGVVGFTYVRVCAAIFARLRRKHQTKPLTARQLAWRTGPYVVLAFAATLVVTFLAPMPLALPATLVVGVWLGAAACVAGGGVAAFTRLFPAH